MGDMKYEFKIGDKLWEKHNHRVVTLKENHRTDSVTKWWHIEEDSMEWREDSLTSIPPYVYLLLKKQQKVEELLELYRLEKEAKEKYHTSGSLYVMQHVLDELREIAEEINLKEKELEGLK